MMRALVLTASLIACAARAEVDVSKLYDVSTDGTSAKVKAGEKGKVVISITAKGGAHVSDEAPLRIELSSANAKLDKDKIVLADSLVKKAGPKDFPNPRFEVGFTASAKTTVEAKMTFFICTDQQCTRQTKQLSLPVEVN